MPFFSPGNVGTVTVTGTVAVSNFPAGFNVNNFPAGFNVNNFPAVNNGFSLGLAFNGWTAFGTGTGNMTSLPAAGGNDSMAFALVDISAANPLWESSLVYFQTKMGAGAPTAGAAIEYYLVRRSDTAGEADDGVADAGMAQQAKFWDQADLCAGFNVTATAAKVYRMLRDLLTFGPLGSTKWGIGVRNGTSGALDGTAGSHINKHNMYRKVAV